MSATATPPVWGERALQAFLTERDFESVSGDLIEEYRECIYAARGPFRADLWYVAQVVGFAWRSSGVWASAFAFAFLARIAMDWHMPTTEFQTRAALSTVVGLGIFLVSGFWAGSRSGSSAAGSIIGGAIAAFALPFQLVGAALLLAVWHDPPVFAAIRNSGGLEEVFTLPLVTILPGVLFGAIGGVLGVIAQRLRGLLRLDSGTSTMNPITSRQRRSGSLAVLVGIVIIVGLLLYCVFTYPASIRLDGPRNGAIVLGALAVYTGTALWARGERDKSFRAALDVGVRIGSVLVLIEILNLALEHFVGNTTISAIRGVASWGAMFLAFGVAGSNAIFASEERGAAGLGRSMVASVWCGVIAAVGAVLGGVALPVFFMSTMVRILDPGAAGGGVVDMPAFVVRHTLAAATVHLLFLPVIAAIFGAIGGSASLLLRSVSRRTAWSLGGVMSVLAIAGVTALRWASTLPRIERPPFVRSGLLAFGLALACAYPVLRAILSAGSAPKMRSE